MYCEDFRETIKLEGYLEKRSKLKLCNWWRRLYFVLERRTLCCAKSEEDYQAKTRLTAKLVVHLGNVNGIRPLYSSRQNGERFQFEIITKGSSIVLSAYDEASRSRWLTALRDALEPSTISPPFRKKHPLTSTPSITSSTFYLFNQQDDTNKHSDSPKFHEEAICGTQLGKQSSETLGGACKVEIHNVTPLSIQPDLIVDCSKIPDEDLAVNIRRKIGSSPKLSGVDRQTAQLRECLSLKLLSIPSQLNRSSSSSLFYRKSEMDFFWSDKNSNWPALDLDLWDDLLEDIRNGHKILSPVVVTDMDTQTDFLDDIEFLNGVHVHAIRDELISFISTSSSSATNSPTEADVHVCHRRLSGWMEPRSPGSNIVEEEPKLTDDEAADYDFVSASESCYMTAESSDCEL